MLSSGSDRSRAMRRAPAVAAERVIAIPCAGTVPLTMLPVESTCSNIATAASWTWAESGGGRHGELRFKVQTALLCPPGVSILDAIPIGPMSPEPAPRKARRPDMPPGNRAGRNPHSNMTEQMEQPQGVEVLAELRSGRRDTMDRLMPVVYDELREIARRQLARL